MPGTQNLAGYFTKHFPCPHHQTMRTQFLTPQKHVGELRRKSWIVKKQVALAQAISEQVYA